jgi:uncharacterized protein (TIGR02391 family)
MLPTTEEASQLPLDELALRLLRHLREQEESEVQLNLRNTINGSSAPVRAGEMDQYLCALTEAWAWLVANGLIGGSHPARQPGEGHAFITRRGYEVLGDENGLARVAAEMRIGVDLHKRIRDRVRPQFLLGEYELAAFAALREVEERVHDLVQPSSALYGTDLMAQAFRLEVGPLFDPKLPRAESEAMIALFRGVIGVFKNPPSHRTVEYADPTEASEVVLLADLLLRMLDRIEARLAATE